MMQCPLLQLVFWSKAYYIYNFSTNCPTMSDLNQWNNKTNHTVDLQYIKPPVV